MRRRMLKKLMSVLLAFLMLFAPLSTTLASSVECSVVDVISPNSSVTLAPGGTSEITINLSVTGKQDGTATFQVYKDWTLSNGLFIGTNPVLESVPPRSSQAPDNVFTISGTITVDNNQNAGPFNLVIGAFDITNTNTQGAKLSAGQNQTYYVNIEAPKDTTAPIITAPADLTKEAAGPLTLVDLGKPTVSDNVSTGVDLQVTNNAPANGLFPVGVTTVTWTATDKAGNSSDASQKVTITDTTAPIITAPGNITMEATGTLTPVILGNATASDLVSSGDDLAVTNDAPSCFPVGDTTVTWTATDKAGNHASATQVVTITDTTAPSITAPNAVKMEATGPLTKAELGTATAFDLVSSGDELVINNDAPAGFPVGDTTVTWTATDKAGNSSVATQIVTITDTTPPSITAPAAVTIVMTGQLTPVNLGSPIVSDLVSSGADIAVTNDAPVDGFPVGTTTVTWTATDKEGNKNYATQLVTITYNFSGFFRPIYMGDDVINTAKAGSAIPVKFSLHGYMGMNVFFIGYPRAIDTTANCLLNNDGVETVTAGGSSLSYDYVTDQYTYIWKTDKAWAGLTKQLVVKLADGKAYTANFKFSK